MVSDLDVFIFKLLTTFLGCNYMYIHKHIYIYICIIKKIIINFIFIRIKILKNFLVLIVLHICALI